MIVFMIPTLQLIQQQQGIHAVDRILSTSMLKKTKLGVEYVVRIDQEETPDHESKQ